MRTSQRNNTGCWFEGPLNESVSDPWSDWQAKTSHFLHADCVLRPLLFCNRQVRANSVLRQRRIWRSMDGIS